MGIKRITIMIAMPMNFMTKKVMLVFVTATKIGLEMLVHVRV